MIPKKAEIKNVDQQRGRLEFLDEALPTLVASLLLEIKRGFEN